jgi:zinc transport system substrate-binding protein
MKNKITLLLVFLTIILNNQLAYSKPNILVTITPIASIVAMLTKDKADIVILDTSGGCPHHHSAKPSDKSLIDNSEMVIYIDDQFDSLVSSMLLNYKGKKVRISDFSSIDFKGIDGQHNWHFWLDLNNVKLILKDIADNIIKTFPEIKKEVTKNLAESYVIIDNLDKLKQSKLVKLESAVLLSDSLEHFFKSIDNSEVKVFDISNASLKNIQKLDDILSSESLKCIVLDVNQNSQSYSKYNKLIIQLDSENWTLKDKTNISGNLFVDQYSKMINLVESCK